MINCKWYFVNKIVYIIGLEMDVKKVSFLKSFFKFRINGGGFVVIVWMSCVIIYGMVFKMKKFVYIDIFLIYFELILLIVVLIVK